MLDYLKEIFYNKPILQFPDPNKPYILYPDASNNAHSGVLCQPISHDQDIGPVAYFSGTFTAQNKVGVQLKKKLMLYCKVCNNLTTILEVQNVPFILIIAIRTIPNQRHEDRKTGQMGNAASGV